MVPMREIRAFARQIAKEFKPRRIILFGSHATGRAHSGSDVDLFVELPSSGHPMRAAVSILRRLRPTLPVDLVVSSPRDVRTRLAKHDWFLMDIVENGKLLYESRDA